MTRRGMRKIAAALVAGALVLAPTTGVSAQADEADPAAVEVVRYGGPDRYSTSLLVAEAFAEDAGGSLEWVILVSGRSWHEAVVASSVAGSLGAPVLMTPPHEVRDDAMGFLKRVGASKALLISTDSGNRPTIQTAVDEQLQDAGLTVERIGGRSQYATGIAVAERLGEVGELGTVGKTAIVASGEVFADALVAGPLSARARIPVLLSPKAELHSGVAEYLEGAGIERVILMGGTAALSDEVENAIGDLDLAIDRMAGSTRFETATLTAGYAAEQAGGGCFAGGKAGLARARVPFDSFSAAPLLARQCAALVLTEPSAVPESTAGYLDDTRRAAGESAATLFVFGGEAAVSAAAIDEYLAGEDEEEAEPETEETAIGPCGGRIDDPPTALLPIEPSAKEADWSPDCQRIAFVNVSALWVMDHDGGNARAIHRLIGEVAGNPAWSPDGSKIAFSVLSWHETRDFVGQRSHIYVVDADGRNAAKLTTGKVEDDYPTWSPDGSRIAFHREIWRDRTVSPPVGTDRYVVTMDPDGSNVTEIGKGGSWESRPAWSPDGTQFAIAVHGSIGIMNAEGTSLRTYSVVAAHVSKLSWSPDGTRVAFSRFENPGERLADGTADIAAFDVETGEVTSIATMEGTDINPDWSSDGQRILFNTFEQNGRITRLFVVGAGEAATGTGAS